MIHGPSFVVHLVLKAWLRNRPKYKALKELPGFEGSHPFLLKVQFSRLPPSSSKKTLRES